MELEIPENGGIYGWGDEIAFRVNVTDPEDGDDRLRPASRCPRDLPRRGRQRARAPGVEQTGCEGTFEAPAESGHAKSAVIALVVTAVYTDRAGPRAPRRR